MFDQLRRDLLLIKTRRFHLIDGPTSPDLRRAIEECPVPFPRSYLQFVFEFGNANLFRRSGIYGLEVFAAPREIVLEDGERLYHFGRSASSFAYLKDSSLSAGDHSVFEQHYPTGLRKTAAGFEEWFERKYRVAKRSFKKKEWEQIVQGPAPFTSDEIDAIEARRKFHWQRVGITEDLDVRFLVTNGSNRRLPFLSLGVRGAITGGVWLPVHDIQPGETKEVDFDCYKKYVPPTEIEIFDLPDPQPEDRKEYWEFSEQDDPA